jgi:tetratricopeptide (TPR) repeat protein
MDLLDGKSLSELIDERKFVPWQQAVDFGIQIADAMAYAHQQGIVHRDLKPANIIISPTAKGEERATVVDFGIAKFANETQNAQKLTQTGEVFGSPLYMSPEQCTGKDLDGRSDIYSFGCMMYETLTGEVPFQGPNAVQTILMQINDPPPSLRSTHNHQPPSSIPGGLETVILHCLEKEPASRYSSMDDVKADLQLVKRGMPPTCKSVRRFRFKLKAPGLVQTGLVTAVGTIGIFLGMAFWINKWQYEMVPWQIAYSSGKHEFERSEYSQALMSAQHGIKLATARNAAKHELANLYILLGDIDRAMHKDGDSKLADARKAYEQAAAVATGEKAAQQRVNANQNLGDMNNVGGDYHAALSKYDAALLAFNNHYNDAGHKARLHIRKAIANENLREYGQATAELEKAAEIYRHEDDMKTPALIETLEKLAENEKAHGDASKAQAYFDEAKKLRAAY